MIKDFGDILFIYLVFVYKIAKILLLALTQCHTVSSHEHIIHLFMP